MVQLIPPLRGIASSDVHVACATVVREDLTLLIVKPGHHLPESETVLTKNEVLDSSKGPGGSAEITRG